MPKTKLNCTTCGNPFEIWPSKLKYQNVYFCSKQCRYGKIVDKTDVPEGFKKCWKCEQIFPATTEYFAWGKLKGFQPYCKPCKTIHTREWRHKNPEHIKEVSRIWKWANPEKVRANMNRHNHSDKGRERSRRYYQTDEYKAHKLAYRLANPDVTQRAKTKYRSKPEKRELEKVTSRNYRITHAEKFRFHAKLRRDWKRANGGTYTKVDIDNQNKRQKNRCYYCRITMDVKYTIEHVIPLSKGGSNDPSNIVLACYSCNIRKNNKFPHEWPEGGRLL
jgi:hypothetical protein